MVSELIAAFIYSAIFIIIFVCGEIIHRRLPSYLEFSRKFVHLLSGTVALTFPYFIQSSWTIFFLSVSFSLIIIITRRKSLLQSVHGVKRRSQGGLFFPLAIYLVFVLSKRNPELYVISILVLTVSDSLAALVGGRYGSIRFDVEGNVKSLEGSISFFFATFLCIHLPLLLMTQIDKLNSILIAFVMAILITAFESIALSGSDNIFIPFGTYYILAKMTRYSAANSLWQIQVLFIIILFVVLINLRPRLLKTSGLIGLILINYAAWSLCDFSWFVPLLMAEIMYYTVIRLFSKYREDISISSYQIKVIFYTGIIPVLVIFLANSIRSYDFTTFIPYLVAVSSQIAIIVDYFVGELSPRFAFLSYVKRTKLRLAMFCVITSVGVISLLPIIVSQTGITALAAVIPGTLISYILHFTAMKHFSRKQDNLWEHRIRMLGTAVGTGMTFFVLFSFFKGSL